MRGTLARMSVRPLALLVLLAAGCGDDSAPREQTRTVPDITCPAGTPQLAVRDVLPKAPSGMKLLRVRKADVDQAHQAFAAGFGDKLRSLRLAVVAPRGRQIGTGIGVLNLTVRADGDTPPSTSQTRQPLTIAGRDGILMATPGGGATRASGSVGDCGVVVLHGPDEASVRRVAEAIRQPG